MSILPKKKKTMQTKSTRFQRRPRSFRAITGLSKEKYNELLTVKFHKVVYETLYNNVVKKRLLNNLRFIQFRS